LALPKRSDTFSSPALIWYAQDGVRPPARVPGGWSRLAVTR
jgi:hypothetical protein